MGILSLKEYFTEPEILEMPINKFRLYVDLVDRRSRLNRLEFVADTVAAISTLGGSDYLEEHRKELTEKL